MQIMLASAKIMNVSIKREQSEPVRSAEREKHGMKSNVSIKREQSELVRFAERERHGMKPNDKPKSVPDVSLSTPRFQNEAQAFAKYMAHYVPELR